MILAAVIRLSLMFILVTASVAKLLNLSAFRGVVDEHPWVPRWGTDLVTIGVPAIELALAAALILGVAGALTVTAVLMALFAASIVGMRVTQTTEEGGQCGCLGGALDLRLDGWSAAANGVIALSAIWAARQAPVAAPLPLSGAALSAESIACIWLMGALLALVFWTGEYARTVVVQLGTRGY